MVVSKTLRSVCMFERNARISVMVQLHLTAARGLYAQLVGFSEQNA